MNNRKFVGNIKIGRKNYDMTLRGCIVVTVVSAIVIVAGLYAVETVIYLLGGR